jgi:shikimate kinase
LESRLLHNIETNSHTIVSTGGGTPCHSNNMDFMLKTGLTVYLKLTPGQLRSRLSESRGDRPLLADLQPEELQSFIEKKLADRKKWYDNSELIVEGIDLDVNKLYSLVKSRLKI